MTFDLTLDFDPVPLARPRFANGRAYLPTRSRDYRRAVQKVVADFMASKNFSPFEGEVSCQVKFFRRFRPSARSFGDLDNLLKALLDATQGLLFKDDAQIVSVTAEKFHDKFKPRTEFSFSTKKARQPHER